MYCTKCGTNLPADANFCPSCGTPVKDQPRGEHTDATTAAIDVGMFDAEAELGEIPDLAPGTGMLVVIRGPGAGSRFLLDRDTTSIGRHPDSHIFLDDVTVSRRHAEVARQGNDLMITDLGSLNGTYINGARVEQQLLRTGDEVQIGRFKLMFVGAGGA